MMGLDLKLAVFRKGASFSQDVLTVASSAELFAAIQSTVEERPVPDPFNTYLSRAGIGDTHYGDTQQTPYGEPLGWVAAEDLRPFSNHRHVRDNARNRAIWALLGELSHEPGEWRVALYWT